MYFADSLTLNSIIDRSDESLNKFLEVFLLNIEQIFHFQNAYLQINKIENYLRTYFVI